MSHQWQKAYPDYHHIQSKRQIYHPGAPINISLRIVGNTLGYPVELSHHNTLTFLQCVAPGLPVLGLATTAKHRQQRLYANNE